MNYELSYDPYADDDEEKKRLEREAGISALAQGAHMSLPEPSLLRDPPAEPPLDAVGGLINAGRTAQLVEEFGADDPESPAPAPDATDPIRGLATANAPEPTPAPQLSAQTVPPKTAEPPPPVPTEQDPFEALMRRGEEQRQKQLEAYDAQGGPSINGWALLADVAFNKGRSIPQMLNQVENDKRAYREGRQKLLTGGTHADPMSQALAHERIQTARQGNKLRGDEAAAKAEKDRLEAEQGKKSTAAFMQVYDSVLNDDEKAALREADPATFRSLSGLMRKKYGNLESTQKDTARGVGMNAAARTHATNVVNNEDQHVIAETAGTVEDARAASQARHLGNKPLTPDQIADNAAREEGLRLQREAAEAARKRDALAAKNRGEDKARQDLNDETSFNTTYSDKTKGAVKVAHSLGPLLDSLGAHPEEFGLENNPVEAFLPEGLAQMGRGLQAAFTTDPNNKEALQRQVKFRSDYNALAQFALLEATGLASNLSEQEKTAIRTGAKPTATAAEMQAGLDAMGVGVKSTLSRYGSPRPDWAIKNIKISGLDNERWAPELRSTPPAAAPVSAEPTTVNEDGDVVYEGVEAGFNPMDVPDNLGDDPKAKEEWKKRYARYRVGQ